MQFLSRWAQEELEKDEKSDPILKFRQLCIDVKIITEKEFVILENEIINQINQEAIWAEEQSDPDDPMKNLYVDENVFENDLFKPWLSTIHKNWWF